MAEYRGFTLPVTLSAATDIALSIVVDTATNDGPWTLDSSAAAYVQIPAGTYRWQDLVVEIAQAIPAWIQSALTGHSSGDLGTDDDPQITFTLTPATTAGGSLLSFVITTTGGLYNPQSEALVIQSATLTNTNGLWTRLGLSYEIDTSRAASVANGVATWSGLFQPRGFFCFERSEEDDGDRPRYPQHVSHALADGSVKTYTVGREIWERTIRLVDQDEEITGRPKRVAVFSSLHADRDKLVLANPSTTGVSGISTPYYQSGILDDNTTAYIHCGEWVARLRDDSSTQVRTCEKWPASITPSAGSPVSVVSEAYALWHEARRLGMVCVLDSDEETGALLWTGAMYSLSGNGEIRWEPARHSVGAALYTVSFDLVRSEKPGLTLAG